MNNRMPIQPIDRDINGVVRFKPNRIVEFLLDNGNYDLNDIARMDFTNEEREQFSQLIGYSLSGFSDLSYVSDDTCEIADNMYYGKETEQEAELKYLRNTLKTIREKLKSLIPDLFKICEEDLEY